MLYLFLDETYRDLPTGKRFVFGCIATPQFRWNDLFRDAQKLNLPGKSTRINRVNTYLARLDGLGVLTFSDIDSKHLLSDEIDGTRDISKMSRYDNLWSDCFAFAVAVTLSSIFVRDNVFKTVDIYYDPKDLCDSHRKALCLTLKDRLQKIIKKYNRRYNLNLGKSIQIRRIEQVKKPTSGSTLDKFQVGTELAHQLCSKTRNLLKQWPPLSHIEVHNHTDVVNGTMQPFYE